MACRTTDDDGNTKLHTQFMYSYRDDRKSMGKKSINKKRLHKKRPDILIAHILRHKGLFKISTEGRVEKKMHHIGQERRVYTTITMDTEMKRLAIDRSHGNIVESYQSLNLNGGHTDLNIVYRTNTSMARRSESPGLLHDKIGQQTTCSPCARL